MSLNKIQNFDRHVILVCSNAIVNWATVLLNGNEMPTKVRPGNQKTESRFHMSVATAFLLASRN